MISHVEIAADGIFVYRWNGKKKLHVRKRAKKAFIYTFLRERCEIAEGTTLGQFLEAVDRYKLLKFFIKQYAWCPQIEEFHAQAKEPVYEPPETKLDVLEIHHHADVEESVERTKHWGGKREITRTVHFDSHYDFHGIGDPEKDSYEYGKVDKVNYSVSATPVNEMVDVPIKLKKEFDVYEKFDPQRHDRDNRPQKLLTVKREFTLLEVLDAVYYDISFYGGPAENKEFIEGLKGMVEEIKSGDVLGIPLEQVMKRVEGGQAEPPKEGGWKVVLHPDVARFLGVDPDSIPMDDKEILRGEDDPGDKGN